MENVVHEPLERGRGVSKAFGDDQPLEGTITGTECRLPLISLSDPDQVVSMAEVDFGIDPGLAGGVEKVGDEGKGIMVLFRDLVESPEVDTKSQRPVLLLDE